MSLLSDTQRRALHIMVEAVEYAEWAPIGVDVDEDRLRHELQEEVLEMLGRKGHGWIDPVDVADWMLEQDERLRTEKVYVPAATILMLQKMQADPTYKDRYYASQIEGLLERMEAR